MAPALGLSGACTLAPALACELGVGECVFCNGKPNRQHVPCFAVSTDLIREREVDVAIAVHAYVTRGSRNLIQQIQNPECDDPDRQLDSFC